MRKVNVPASGASWMKPRKCAYPGAESSYPATKIVCVCAKEGSQILLPASKARFVAKINQCLFLGVMGSWTPKQQQGEPPPSDSQTFLEDPKQKTWELITLHLEHPR